MRVIKAYDNGSEFPFDSDVAASCSVAWFVPPVRHFAVDFLAGQTVADKRVGSQVVVVDSS